jgi:hypothetical protein
MLWNDPDEGWDTCVQELRRLLGHQLAMGTTPGRTDSVWIRLLRHCWKPLVWVWGAVLLAVGVNVGSSWLLAPSLTLKNTPLGWIIEHPALTLPLAGAFLVLTGLARLTWVQADKQTDEHTALAQQNRVRMRQHLAQWYQNFLASSLDQAMWLDLDLADKPDALFTPLVVRDIHLPERLLPSGTSIIQVYDEAHQELLILGEPGSGKSTQLYLLAQHLLTLTENDQTAPLPIVFPLSSWAQNGLPLETWMAEQLKQTYQVPKRLAQQWVQDQQIIPLLDGLDEMEEAARPRCLQAINRYHLEHVHPLVVCSRSAEHTTAAQSEQFTLQRAVVVQPLTATQIETRLTQGGRQFAGLRAAYRQNAALRELATAPLWLNLLISTYQGNPPRTPGRGLGLAGDNLLYYVLWNTCRYGTGLWANQ